MPTIPDKEPAIINEFRMLYDYVRLMGDQVNQIYSRIDRLENGISVLNERSHGEIRANFRDLVRIKELVMSMKEVTAFFESLAASVLPLPELREIP
jgi:hypothetical protein